MTKIRQKNPKKGKSESYGTLVFECFGPKSEKKWVIRAFEIEGNKSGGLVSYVK